MAHRAPPKWPRRRRHPVRPPARPDELGYAGTYDSGFPDEHAFADWLLRVDTLVDNHRYLTEGERVSGPAADQCRHHVRATHQAFAGRVLTSHGQARDLVTNPLLQIYPGRAMTCVFDPAKALCQLRASEDDVRRTPDQDDCPPTFQNIAYTPTGTSPRRAATRGNPMVPEGL